MAINKEKNVTLQITFSKFDMEMLNELVEYINKHQLPKTTKSEFMTIAFRRYALELLKQKEVEEKESNNA